MIQLQNSSSIKTRKLPVESIAYDNNMTNGMQNSKEQLAASMKNCKGEMNLKTELSIQYALKTREWNEVEIARIAMTIR